MDQGWDHTENEDKLLLAHTMGMGTFTDRDMGTVMHLDMSINSVARIGCTNTSNDLNIVVDTRLDYNKHLSSIVINNINVLCLRIINSLNFDFDEICSLFNWFNFWIYMISKICNSTSTCKCNCSCEPQCKSNTICLCLCKCTKTEINRCCICFCKHGDSSSCKCICICICNKPGGQCCCADTKTHECKECLVKINLSTLLRYNCTILRCLNFIKCSISRIENLCCLCYCCQVSQCDGSCCEQCPNSIKLHELIISRIGSIESCFDYVETIIGRLQKFKNILSPISLIASKCKSCGGDCCIKVDSLIKNIEKALRYYHLSGSRIEDIRSFVEYQMNYNKSKEIITSLEKSVKPLSIKLGEINTQVLGTVDNTIVVQANKLLMSVMSRTVIDESIFVMSRLYMYSKIKSQIFEILSNIQSCKCINLFDKSFTNIYLSKKLLKTFVNRSDFNQYYLHKDIDNTGNYICLCLVIKYVLLTDIHVLNNYNEYIYHDISSWISRKFKKYTYLKTYISLGKTIMLLMKVIYKITIKMKNIYNENNNCYCTKINERYHPYLISIILFVSSLIENIWTMDSESLRVSIECLSSLYSQLEIYDLYSLNDNKNLSCNSVYSLMVIKESKSRFKDKCYCCYLTKVIEKLKEIK